MFKLFLLLNPLYVTFFWTLVLNINPRESKIPKIFLGRFMFVALLIYISHFFYYLPIPEVYHYIDPFYLLFNLSVFPLYFIYIRLLTVDEKLSLKKHLPYLLIPIILFILYTIGILMMSKEEHLHFVYDDLKNNLPLLGLFLYLKTMYTICRIVFILQGILYVFLSFKLIKLNKANIQHYYTNTADDSLDKIHLLNLTLAITILSSLIISAFGKEYFLTNEKFLIIPSILYSSMLFIIGWLGNMQSPVHINIEENIQENDITSITLTTSQQRHFRLKIEEIFEKKKIYLNKDLTIWDLAREIGTNRTYISTIINNDFNQNFSAFVNAYRINHAQKLIKKNPTINNYDLADSSGFGSVVSMQRAFQTVEGKTLKQIRDKISTSI